MHKSQFRLKCQTNFATNSPVIEMTHWLLCILAHTHCYPYTNTGANKHSRTHIALMKRNIFETMLIANDANRSCIERSICNQIIGRNSSITALTKNMSSYLNSFKNYKGIFLWKIGMTSSCKEKVMVLLLYISYVFKY